MKVKDLIDELKKLDPESDVILQKDPEGNGYHECRGAEDCWYDREEGLQDDAIYDNQVEAEADYSNVIKGCVIYP